MDFDGCLLMDLNGCSACSSQVQMIGVVTFLSCDLYQAPPLF